MTVDGWGTFWGWVVAVAIGGFAGLSTAVAFGGLRDVKSMFRQISEQHREQERH